LTRKRISRHVESCETCSARRRRLASAPELLTAYAALPFLAASPFAASPSVAASPSAATKAAPAIDLDAVTGFPRSPRVERRLHAVPALLAVGVLTVLGLAVVRCDPAPTVADTSETAAAMTSVGPRIQAPSGSRAPSPRRSSAPPARSPSPLVSPEPAPPFTVSVTQVGLTCTIESNTYKLHVEAKTSTAMVSARLYWIEEGWPRHSLPLDLTSGSTGEVTKVLLKNPTVWWVRAVAADGREAETAHLNVGSPCP
jgi:hypothetical protein